MALKIQDGETIVFTGDSITDCGRRNDHQALGNGYVNLFSCMTTAREPQKSISIVNTGIGGNTAEDLRNRWLDDVMVYEPDWISIKIGINDCARYLGNPENAKQQEAHAFAEILEELLAFTLKAAPDVKLLLIDPFYCSLDYGADLKGSYRSKIHAALPAYIATIHHLAKTYSACHVKTHDLFQERFQHTSPTAYFAHEPVHPNLAGHMMIADAVYAALSD